MRRALPCREPSSPCSRMGSRPTAPLCCPTRWSPMSGPIASSRARSERLRRLAPAVALLLVALLAGLSVGSSWLVARHLRNQALKASSLYSVAFRGLADPYPGAANRPLRSEERPVGEE